MSRPLIAVSAAIELTATAFGEVDCTKLTTAYTDAIYAAGGQPVILPVVTDPPRGLLSAMHGLVLTGGGDLDPTMYGEAPDATIYGVRRDRDEFETALIREAAELALPTLAICRGLQLINVLRGGTLIQDIEPVGSHWQSQPAAEASHEISVQPASALSAALGSTPTPWVNSYHHQAVGRLGADLSVSASCGDVIEAFEDEQANLVAVQWHPEQMALTDEHQAGLFAHLVTRATKYATKPQEALLCPTT